MPLTKDLVGLGTPAKLADALGLNPVAAVTAAGTASTDATVVKKAQNVINMTATGSDGIRLPSDAPLNSEYIVYNSSGSNGKVYPSTGGTLNGGSTDAGLTMATLKVAWFMRLSTNVWIYGLTA